MKLTKKNLYSLIEEEMKERNIQPVDKGLLQSLFRRLQGNFGTEFNITKSSVRDGEDIQYQITMEFKGVETDRGSTMRRSRADTVDIYHIFKGQTAYWALLHANDDRQDIPANRENLKELIRIIAIFVAELRGTETTSLSQDTMDDEEDIGPPSMAPIR